MTPVATTGQMAATGIIGAIIVIIQTLIQALLPDQYWQLVQQSAQFWPAVQTLLLFFALHRYGKVFSNGNGNAEALSPPVAVKP